VTLTSIQLQTGLCSTVHVTVANMTHQAFTHLTSVATDIASLETTIWVLAPTMFPCWYVDGVALAVGQEQEASTHKGYEAADQMLNPPVPCMDKWPTSSAATPAASSAALSTACCAGPLGAVRLLDRPSWFTALPRMMAAGVL
jgi:hypothetical protein